jgi:hypothetical protein
MLRRRGVLTMRFCAVVNTVGAAARLALLTPFALMSGGRPRSLWRTMRFWTRLHMSNLLAKRSVLEDHR